jgi:hypothetical protein
VSQFEYLSVFVSIIVGIGASHLILSAARLIQVRKRTTFYLPTLFWMFLLLLLQVQVWWVLFQRSEVVEWQFFLFLFYLLIPIGVVLLSYLIVPDLTEPTGPNLRASYYENRRWLYGILALLPIVSLSQQLFENGAIPINLDSIFRAFFLALALVGWSFSREWVQFVISATLLVGFLGYVLVLFLRLQ